jgi:hypothetical protein
MTKPTERDYYAEAKALLQRDEARLPPDTDNELRRCYSHPAVIEQMAAMMQFPEAFKDMPMSFRMTVKCYEDEQRRKEEQKKMEEEQERNRPRLRTENPPQYWIDQAAEKKVTGYFLAGLCGALLLITLILAIQAIPFAIISFVLGCLLAWGSTKAFKKAAQNRTKWEMTYHTIVYTPALKSGRDATVEIQLELPVGWKNPDTLARLESCAKPSLYALFAESDTVPLRSKVWDCIERQLAVKQQELSLGICRMELLKNVDPAMPPFGSRHVFSSNGIIVTYEIADLWRTDAVNAKIAEIVAANPNTDLTRHAEALNIRFIDIEKQPEKKSSPKGFAFNG